MALVTQTFQSCRECISDLENAGVDLVQPNSYVSLQVARALFSDQVIHEDVQEIANVLRLMGGDPVSGLFQELYSVTVTYPEYR